MAEKGNSKRAIYAILAGNIAVAAIRFGAAFLSGRSAMRSRAVHPTIDSGDQVLLLHGMMPHATFYSKQVGPIVWCEFIIIVRALPIIMQMLPDKCLPWTRCNISWPAAAKGEEFPY